VGDVTVLDLLGGIGAPYINARNVNAINLTGQVGYGFSLISAATLNSFKADNSVLLTGKFFADNVGDINVSGNFTAAGLVTKKGAITNILVSKDLMIKDSSGAAGDIISATGIGAIVAGGNLSAGFIRVLNGNIMSITVGASPPPFGATRPDANYMRAQVRADTGSVGDIVVSGNFTLPSSVAAPTIALVSAPKGAVGDISVAGCLGGGSLNGQWMPEGTIVGKSIGVITVTGDPGGLLHEGDIQLAEIRATAGNVAGLNAAGYTNSNGWQIGGVIPANVLAYGGSILSVAGVVVKGDLEALAKISYQPTASATGGNIGAVRARDLRSKLIHADFFLTSVTTTGAGLGPTTIEAQGGATLTGTGSVAARAAIDVNLAGTFSGAIHFMYSSRIPNSLAATYSANFRDLLDFTDAKTASSWLADNAPEGVGDDVTLQDAVFTEVNGVLGLSKYGHFLQNGNIDTNWYIGH
jgi:hypothetical protein